MVSIQLFRNPAQPRGCWHRSSYWPVQAAPGGIPGRATAPPCHRPHCLRPRARPPQPGRPDRHRGGHRRLYRPETEQAAPAPAPNSEPHQPVSAPRATPSSVATPSGASLRCSSRIPGCGLRSGISTPRSRIRTSFIPATPWPSPTVRTASRRVRLEQGGAARLDPGCAAARWTARSRRSRTRRSPRSCHGRRSLTKDQIKIRALRARVPRGARGRRLRQRDLRARPEGGRERSLHASSTSAMRCAIRTTARSSATRASTPRRRSSPRRAIRQRPCLTDTARETLAGDKLIPSDTNVPLNFQLRAPRSERPRSHHLRRRRHRAHRSVPGRRDQPRQASR